MKSVISLRAPSAGARFVRLDAAQIRRDVRRLFGRIQHGGNVCSLDSGRTVACGVGDVFVVVAEDAAAERRKSGADAWSARVQKGEETETPLAEFLLEKARFENASTPEAGEPPYHRVRRVFARRRGEEEEPRVVEETLWDAHVSAEDGSGAAARRMASLNLGGLGHSPETRGGSPRSYAYGSPSASRIGGFQASETASFRAGGDAPRRGRAVAASSLLPGHCWEEVFARCDPASVARLGATCAELAELARSSLVRQAQHAKLFGRAAPVGSPARFPRPPRAGAPIPPSPPARARRWRRRRRARGGRRRARPSSRRTRGSRGTGSRSPPRARLTARVQAAKTRTRTGTRTTATARGPRTTGRTVRRRTASRLTRTTTISTISRRDRFRIARRENLRRGHHHRTTSSPGERVRFRSRFPHGARLARPARAPSSAASARSRRGTCWPTTPPPSPATARRSSSGSTAATA